MDPANNQPIVTPQVPNVNVQPPQAPQALQVPPVQAEQVVKSTKPRNKKVILLIVLIALLVIAIAVAGYYLLNSSKQNEKANVVVAPTPTPVVSAVEEDVDVAQVAGVTDLDNLIVGLAQADESLDQELTQLEKDSDF